MIVWLFACGSASSVVGEPLTPVVVERGTGELAGMLKIPAATVNGGAPPESHGPPPGHGPGGGPKRPPPPRGPGGGPPRPPPTPAPLPSFACGADEVIEGRCPGLHHDPLERREVSVSAFWLDENEVTRGQYAEFLEATGYRPPHVEEEWAEEFWNWDGPAALDGYEDHAVALTSWYDAREYCAWRGARLPTEAEWQLAAHGPAGDEWDYPWGPVYEEGRMNRGKLEPPNYDDADGYLTTSPVGHYPGGKSRYGVNDLYGNVWEWVADVRVRSWDEVVYDDADTRLDPHTTPLGLYAAARGFAYFADPRPSLRMEYNAFPVELRRKTSGFRCARDLSP